MDFKVGDEVIDVQWSERTGVVISIGETVVVEFGYATIKYGSKYREQRVEGCFDLSDIRKLTPLERALR